MCAVLALPSNTSTSLVRDLGNLPVASATAFAHAYNVNTLLDASMSSSAASHHGDIVTPIGDSVYPPPLLPLEPPAESTRPWGLLSSDSITRDRPRKRLPHDSTLREPGLDHSPSFSIHAGFSVQAASCLSCSAAGLPSEVITTNVVNTCKEEGATSRRV